LLLGDNAEIFRGESYDICNLFERLVSVSVSVCRKKRSGPRGKREGKITQM
jgi:hypothetical protein